MTTSGRYSPNKVRTRMMNDSWVRANSGMVFIRPSSVDTSGALSAASIGANGSVTFSLCSSVSINGVFSSLYDNYVLIYRGNSSDNGGNLMVRLRTGSTDASGSNYTFQGLFASATSITGGRTTGSTSGRFLLGDDKGRGGGIGYVYGPFLTQPTVFRGITSAGGTSPFLREFAVTHSLSTSYESISLLTETAGQTISGVISIYGLGI